jgi:hypothetical protein
MEADKKAGVGETSQLEKSELNGLCLSIPRLLSRNDTTKTWNDIAIEAGWLATELLSDIRGMTMTIGLFALSTREYVTRPKPSVFLKPASRFPCAHT